MENTRICKSCGEKRVIFESVTGTWICELCGIEEEFDNFQSPLDGFGEASGNFIPLGSCRSSVRVKMNGERVFVSETYGYREKKANDAQKAIADITSRLGLSAARAEDVKSMIDTITEGELGAGDWFPILIGACSYMVVRQNQLPLTIAEVAAVISSDVHELGRMFNRVRNFLDIKLPNLNIEIILERAIQSCPSFSGICEEKKNVLIKQGRFLLQCSVKWFLTTGRLPLPMVAAVLAFLSEVNVVSANIEDIAKELYATIATSKLRYRELQENLVKAAQALPWGKDVTVKNLVQHAPFILQYMEMKSRSKPLRGEDAVSDSNCTGATISKCDSNTLPFDLKGILSGCLQVESALGCYPTERDLQYFDCESYGSWDANLDDFEKLKLSEECLRQTYVKFLAGDVSVKPIYKTPHQREKRKKASTFQDSIEKGGIGILDSSKRLSLDQILERDVGFSAFPPSFVAGLEACRRRRKKIVAAKLRISEVMHGAKQWQRGVKGSGIDWEDCIVELLLLHGANEAKIEQGHYNTLLDLHVFNSIGSPGIFTKQTEKKPRSFPG